MVLQKMLHFKTGGRRMKKINLVLNDTSEDKRISIEFDPEEGAWHFEIIEAGVPVIDVLVEADQIKTEIAKCLGTELLKPFLEVADKFGDGKLESSQQTVKDLVKH
jgi:hypothetical protein